GMGIGDINGDGRMDLVNAYGWWEQPPKGSPAAWTYHPENFGRWNRSSPGGGEMAIYDVNGDGLNDVVTSLQAHGWGLSWFEQKRNAGGKISFQEHMIMGDFSTKNAGGVTFSELHGSTFADIDGDGVPDFIVGKRFWSHLDNFIDPDPHGPPVLYVYRTVRNPKAPGGAAFVRELIHNRSGIGSHAAVADLNNDGALDIITSTKRGTFIFWNTWRKKENFAKGEAYVGSSLCASCCLAIDCFSAFRSSLESDLLWLRYRHGDRSVGCTHSWRIHDTGKYRHRRASASCK